MAIKKYKSFLDTISFEKVLKDNELSCQDKVIFVYIITEYNKHKAYRQKNTYLNFKISKMSEELDIPKKFIKMSINNLSKYIKTRPRLIKGGLVK